MQITDEAIKESRIKAEVFVKSILEKSEILTDEYLQNLSGVELLDIKKTRDGLDFLIPTPESMEKIKQITYAYIYNAFSEDVNIKNKFRKHFGLKETHLCWFIPLSQILKEIDKINSGVKFRILPFETIELIHTCLEQKIFKTVTGAFFGYIEDNNKIKSFLRYEYDSQLRKKEHENNKDILKANYHNMFVQINKIGEILENTEKINIKPERFITKLFEADFNSDFMKLIYNNCLIPITETNKIGQKQILIFDLFKLLFKDENECWDEDEFLANVIDNKLKFRNYNRYKESFIRNKIKMKDSFRTT